MTSIDYIESRSSRIVTNSKNYPLLKKYFNMNPNNPRSVHDTYNILMESQITPGNLKLGTKIKAQKMYDNGL